MGSCCQSTKSSHSHPQENFEKPVKPTTKIENDQQQEKPVNPPLAEKNTNNIIRSNTMSKSQPINEEIKQNHQAKDPENKTEKIIKEVVEENGKFEEPKVDPEPNPELTVKPSDNSNYNIIKESNGFQKGAYVRDSNLHNFNDNDAVNNEFSIFENRKSFHEVNRLSLQKGMSEQDKNRQSVSKGSERKNKYILTENSESVDNNLLYLQEKKLFDLRNEFLERLPIKKYFSLLFEKNYFYEEDYNKIKGVANEVKDLTDKLFELHNLVYTELQNDIEHSANKTTIECKGLSEKDLDYFIPLFFFEFSLYPITFIKNAKLKKVFFASNLKVVGNGSSENKSAFGVSENHSIYYSCGERTPKLIKKSMHNEMYKYVYNSGENKLFYDDDWETLNIPGFKYGTQDYQSDYVKYGFLNFLCTQEMEEDKAEVFSYMFNNPVEAFDSKSTHLWNKVNSHLSFLEKFDPRGTGGEQFWVLMRELRRNLEKYFLQKD